MFSNRYVNTCKQCSIYSLFLHHASIYRTRLDTTVRTVNTGYSYDWCERPRCYANKFELQL